MAARSVRLGLAAVWLLCVQIPASAADRAASVPEFGFPSLSGVPTAEKLSLERMRRVHEVSVFLLRHYSMLEALITAVEDGNPENDAFWIGSASILPGAGQMINHDYLQGGLLLFASGLSWTTIDETDFLRPRRTPRPDLLPWYYVSRLASNGIMTYAMMHACNASYRDHRDRTAAMWTGTASIVPGVGQAINGQWWEAAGFFFAWALSAYLTNELERGLVPPGQEATYLTRPHEGLAWSVSWLPGGARVNLQAKW